MLNTDANPNKHVATENIDKTLQELDRQQNERVSNLVDQLLVQQRELLNKILEQQGVHHNSCVSPQNNFLKELLIRGELLSPLEAVERRQKSMGTHCAALTGNRVDNLRGNR